MTLGDLYEALEVKIFENPKFYGNLIITKVESVSTAKVLANVAPEERLREFKIYAVSEDDSFTTCIDLSDYLRRNGEKSDKSGAFDSKWIGPYR